MLSRMLGRQFLSFLGVGMGAAFLNWLTRLCLSTRVTFSLAVVLAYGVGMISAFVLNRFWVFPHANRPLKEQILSFVGINLAFFPVVWGLSLKAKESLLSLGITTYTEEIAHALALALPMVLTFLFYKFVTFKGSKV